MELFRRKKKGEYPEIQSDKYELVLRCSICTGEQVLCQKDRNDGSLHELMLIKSIEDLRRVCEINNIDPESVRKVY